jgi:TPR repeat protein
MGDCFCRRLFTRFIWMSRGRIALFCREDNLKMNNILEKLYEQYGLLCVLDKPPANFAEAIAELEQIALDGDVALQAKLGEIYSEGVIVPKDDVAAHKWFELAANNGNPVAQLNFGKHYLYGVGCDQDEKVAATWLLKAVRQGDTEAYILLGSVLDELGEIAVVAVDVGLLVMLGEIYSEGVIVPEDEVAAHNWYELAATAGDLDAQFNCGMNYMHGVGCGRDKKVAATWLLKAALQGDSEAQFFLGEYAWTGGFSWHDKKLDADEDVDEIDRLWSPSEQKELQSLLFESAKQGHAEALYLVGKLFEFDGDVGKAKGCYSKAANLGCKSANVLLSLLEKKCPAIAAAESLPSINSLVKRDITARFCKLRHWGAIIIRTSYF